MAERRIRILIVDDEKIVRDFFKRLLSFLGVDVVDVDNGASAVELVHQSKFDLFFIDVRMPGMNGLDTYRQIRKIDPEAMVVMMTGYAVEEILEQAQQEGAACHIHKPFDISEIREVIARAGKEQEAGQQRKVLVIDDEEVVLGFFSSLLKEKGLPYSVTTSGREALELVRKDKYDLIFLDLVLKDTNGADLYKEIKQIDPAVDIVLMTGYRHKAEELKGEADIAGCIYKPFEMESILRYIEMAKARANG